MTVRTNPATELALPLSVQIVAILLMVQGLVRLGFLTNNFFQQGPRMLAGAPVQFVLVFLLPAVLGILAISASIVILARSPIARTFGLVVGVILLLSQCYFFASTLRNLSLIKQPTPMFLLGIWVITPAYFLVFIATLVCLAIWVPQTESDPFVARRFY